MPFPQLMEELLDLVRDDAEALGCVAEIEHVRSILAHGTSAHHQLAVFKAALADGASSEEATRAVVDHLIVETARGV
jgi:carboxylate-amine ligase